MKRLTLIADKRRKNFNELVSLATEISRAMGTEHVEIASSDDDIENLAPWNVTNLPVMVVDGKTIIVLNPKNRSAVDAIKHTVA